MNSLRRVLLVFKKPGWDLRYIKRTQNNHFSFLHSSRPPVATILWLQEVPAQNAPIHMTIQPYMAPWQFRPVQPLRKSLHDWPGLPEWLHDCLCLCPTVGLCSDSTDGPVCPSAFLPVDPVKPKFDMFNAAVSQIFTALNQVPVKMCEISVFLSMLLVFDHL